MQPQIGSAGEGLAVTLLRYGLAAFGELVIYNAGQLGVLSGQANVNLGFGAAIHIVYRTYGGNNVTGNINLVVACAGYLAVSILHGIYVNLAVSCINCAVAVLLIGINDIDLAAVNINGCTADVSKQAVAYAGDIYIAVDVNRAANCSAVACMCIQTCSAVFIKAAAVAVQHYFNITVDSGAACMAVYAHSRIIALNINIYIAVNSKITLSLANTLCTLAALRAVELNNQLISLHRAVHIYILCNACITLAGIGYINGQSFAAGINCSALNKIHTLSAFAAYVDGSIFGKFVAAISLNNLSFGILFISIRITGKCCSKFSSGRLAVGALAIIGKLNLAALDGYAVIGQTAGNSYGTQQVFRIICIIGVGQLACQCIQNTVEFSTVLGIHFAAVGYHVDSRIFSSIMNNNIAGSIITCCRTVIIMFIEYSSMATVIIDINICFIILENQACISFAAAAAKLVDMRNAVISVILRCGRRRQLAQADAIGQGKRLVVPYCIILQPQVNLAGLFGSGIVNNACPGRFIIGQADIYLTCTVEVRFTVAIVTHSQHVALDNNGFISGCGCIGINVDSTAVVGDAVKCLGIILRSINIYIAVRGNGRSF